MFGLEQEPRRQAIGFIVRTTITVVGALFAVVLGTAHLAKFDQEQLLKAKLIGDTEINGLVYGPYYTGDAQVDATFCQVSGSYQIKNIGKYPFIVKQVSIELWELPYINASELDAGNVVSYALSERLQHKSPFSAQQRGDTVVIDVGEQYGVGNQLQRSFGFIVPIDAAMQREMRAGRGSRFVVIANAMAHVDDRKPWYSRLTGLIAGDPGIGFLPNDLRHITATFNICNTQ